MQHLGLRLCAVAALATLSCGRLAPPGSVAARIEALSSQPVGSTVRISDLTDFTWDGLAAFGPYTTCSEADSVLRFHWNACDSFRLYESDSFSLIVFTQQNTVTRVEQLPRTPVEFAPSSLRHLYSPPLALFTLVRENGRLLLATTAQ
jgi:hypothetical protein